MEEFEPFPTNKESNTHNQLVFMFQQWFSFTMRLFSCTCNYFGVLFDRKHKDLKTLHSNCWRFGFQPCRF